ncbi:GntR family transcriptional regulator [Paenibacillus alkalitolerans]|uniref:GntR family transcriptional regulator n=1 Tax=Paenibacillus alkalitolerans TaxID=2799335 RepID=UPI0018F381BC|nr:GntR family transcriptional regulator [Paenibacillus alkalitolerans]
MSIQSLRYMQIKEQLIRHIASLQPHDRLPSRTVLSESYQVARTTIERAVSELIGEGLLYARDGSGTYVSEKNNARIGRAAQDINNWGLLIPDIQHYNYPDIVRGASDVASENEINLIICNTDNDYEKQTRHIQKLIDSKVQGVMIVPAIYGKSDFSPFYKLVEAEIPFVFCHRMLEGFHASSVISNNFYAGYSAAKHLIATGCKRIAFISRPVYSASSQRFQGYVSALAEAGIPVRQERVVFESSFESDGEGYFSALRFLRQEERPDGLFCFNDGIARGAYAAAAELGIAVGTDIRIVGCDNTDICQTLPVKLTSVKFQTYNIGFEAARLLLEGRARDNAIQVLQPELIVRES